MTHVVISVNMTTNKSFIRSIGPGEIALIYVDLQLKERIKEAGIRIRQASRKGQRQKDWLYILFEPENQTIFSHAKGGVIENKELTVICLFLNRQEIPFYANFKMDLSPSDYMRHLQKIGVLKETFREISWESGEEKIVEVRPKS